jgi:hypothetical protein
MTVKLLRAFGGFAAGASYDGAADTELSLVQGGNATWDTSSATPGGGPGDSITAGGGSGVILNSTAITSSQLLKTGPSKVYSIVQTSGAGKPTVRNGVTVGGALVTGWGDGGASGLTLTANTPYTPGVPPTDFANGIYVEINGTATVIVFYQ